VSATEVDLKTIVVAADGSAVRHWFAVYTVPRHEKRVALHFQLRQIEHYLPLYQEQRNWKNGLRQIVQFPLFPNYLFVQITRESRVPVLAIPGVISLIGDGKELSSISDSYMQALRESLVQSKAEPHCYLVNGEKVRIKAGAMAGMEGVLVRKKNGFRVVVTLELIKRSVAVEVDIADVEPCCAIPLRYLRTEAMPVA
jgi:transcription antitermination factor NusG